VGNEDRKKVRTQTGEDDATRRQPTPFDWATDVDVSDGLSPVAMSDTTTLEPAAIDHLPVSNQPANVTTDSPTPVELDKHAPCLPDDTVTPPQPVRTPPKPTVTPPNVSPSILPVTYPPRDFSSLHTGTKNPWGSIQRRCDHSYPPRDFSVLRSGTPNPWGSLRHCNCRSHSPHLHHVYSHPEPLRHSYLSPSTSETRLGKPQLHLPSLLHPHPIPVHIFQTIQHPHGISSTKPKITKTIPMSTTKIPKNTHTARCVCGNVIPAYSPDRRSWRFRDRRFRRRSRRFWIANEDVRYVWGGHL
jgi:hypothetical protein